MNKKLIMEMAVIIGKLAVYQAAVNAIVAYGEITVKRGLKGRPVMVETTPKGKLKITTIKEDK